MARSAPARSTCRRPARAAKRLASRAIQVHADRPAHAGEKRCSTSTTGACPTLRWRSPTRSRSKCEHLDADVVQIDEANLPGSPDEWPLAAQAINRVLDAVKTMPAVHLCFGNYGGQSIQKGDLGQADRLSQRAHVDHIVMETAHRPAEELEVFREPAAGDRLRPRRHRHQIDRDRVAPTQSRAHRTRREASSGRAASRYVHPDCGFWMLKRNIADGKMRALVAGRDRYEGLRR